MYEDKSSPYNAKKMLHMSLQYYTTMVKLSKTCNNTVFCITKRHSALF